MQDSLRTGITFGLTSAVITTLGLMVGLHSGTHSRMVVLSGVITIAVADAFSDALGIHLAVELEDTHTTKQIWVATIGTFLAKFLFALTFVIPIFLFPLSTAIIISLLWGGVILTTLSCAIARNRGQHPGRL